MSSLNSAIEGIAMKTIRAMRIIENERQSNFPRYKQACEMARNWDKWKEGLTRSEQSYEGVEQRIAVLILKLRALPRYGRYASLKRW